MATFFDLLNQAGSQMGLTGGAANALSPLAAAWQQTLRKPRTQPQQIDPRTFVSAPGTGGGYAPWNGSAGLPAGAMGGAWDFGGGAAAGVGAGLGAAGGGQPWMRRPPTESRNAYGQPGLADMMIPWQIGQWMSAPQNMVDQLNYDWAAQTNRNVDRQSQRQMFNRLMDVIGGAVGSNRMSGFQDTVSGQGASLPGSVTSGIKTGAMETGDIRSRLRGMIPAKKTYQADKGASAELRRTLEALKARSGYQNMMEAETQMLPQNASLARQSETARADDSLSKAGLLAALEAGNVQSSTRMRVPLIRALLGGLV